MRIEIYTDGSATTKDKPGGWAWVIVINGQFHSEGSGSMPSATNNDAELEAAIQGLGKLLQILTMDSTSFMPNGVWHANLDPSREIVLRSDSEIILKWANGTYRFKQEAKRLKYDQLRWLMKRLQAGTKWVEGHAGHEWNERCDKLAGIERDKAMGKEPRKKSTKSTLMLRTIKEIDMIVSRSLNGSPELDQIKALCAEFVGNK